jgi:hypothetical protein
MTGRLKQRSQLEAPSNPTLSPTLNRNRLLKLLGSTTIAAAVGIACAALVGPMPVEAQQPAKPDILVIFGDDVGQTNISACSFGVVMPRTQ